MALKQNLDTYRENLQHVVRPDKISERQESTRVHLNAWEALAMLEGMRVLASYSKSEQFRDIAQAYAEYIEMLVYEERQSSIYLYAHTPAAEYVLADGAMETDMAVCEHLINRVRDDVHE